jgi:hypothetical protein
MTTRNLVPPESPPEHVGKNLDDGYPAQPDTHVLLGRDSAGHWVRVTVARSGLRVVMARLQMLTQG